MEIEKILEQNTYGLSKKEKQEFLSEILIQLTKHHYDHCKEYRSMIEAQGLDLNAMKSYYDIPHLPVSLFKELDLKSIEKEDIFKTMTSSGTTGQMVSKIYLDRITAANQQKILAKIVTEFTGTARMPMLIIDSPSVLKDRAMFSARGAGILGFSIFGSQRTYALDEDMKINIRAVEEFLEKHQGKNILLFGFTFMIWQYFYKELVKTGKTLDLSKAILIHGGGWKKLLNEAVSQEEFAKRLKEICGIQRIHNYYGMVEQTGTIYMECERGHMHTSIFSDIIIRRHTDFKPCEIGETGIIQVLSMLPTSYPGHSLLTEDEGVLLGEDDCQCKRLGKYFKINGRLKNAEIRGCGDTYGTKL